MKCPLLQERGYINVFLKRKGKTEYAVKITG